MYVEKVELNFSYAEDMAPCYILYIIVAGCGCQRLVMVKIRIWLVTKDVGGVNLKYCSAGRIA